MRKTRVENGTPCCMRLPSELLQRIKIATANRMLENPAAAINHQDLIREALERAFPAGTPAPGGHV